MKADVLIYGAGKYGRDLIKKAESYSEINIIGVADSSVQGELCGYEILNMFDGQTTIAQDVVIVLAMANVSHALDIAKRLSHLGYNNIYLYLNKKKTFLQGFWEGECIQIEDADDFVLPSVEIHTVDFCNLNCKGCVHFSPLFDKKLPDFNTRIQDLYSLKRLFRRILMLSLLGGEPFLNPEIDKYIIESRKQLPNTEIQIITNGLLLLSVSEQILKTISDNRITVVISEYEPTHRIINEIENRLLLFQIDYSIRALDRKEKFNRPLSICTDSKYNKKCISDGCISVCDGKIARCPTLLYIDKFNERFQQELPDVGILVLSDYEDGGCLTNKLKEKVPLCEHCIDYEIDWGICGRKAQIEDFSALD